MERKNEELEMIPLEDYYRMNLKKIYEDSLMKTNKITFDDYIDDIEEISDDELRANEGYNDIKKGQAYGNMYLGNDYHGYNIPYHGYNNDSNYMYYLNSYYYPIYPYDSNLNYLPFFYYDPF
jgi:hypothetical protein